MEKKDLYSSIGKGILKINYDILKRGDIMTETELIEKVKTLENQMFLVKVMSAVALLIFAVSIFIDWIT